jgi:hypothetical protein
VAIGYSRGRGCSSEEIAADQTAKRAIPEARKGGGQDHQFGHEREPYPFSAGWFMCLKLKHISAEACRRHLLEKLDIGVIADGESDIRVAVSAADLDDLAELHAITAAAARGLCEGEADAGG